MHPIIILVIIPAGGLVGAVTITSLNVVQEASAAKRLHR